jgi:hypothetical protein
LRSAHFGKLCTSTLNSLPKTCAPCKDRGLGQKFCDVAAEALDRRPDRVIGKIDHAHEPYPPLVLEWMLM